MRRAPALALAATLLVSALGPPAPVGAADPRPADRHPAVWVQVVVKEFYIWDDRDWGDGDFDFGIVLNCYGVPRGCAGSTNAALDSYSKQFRAGRGKVAFDLALPQSSERFHPNFEASVDAGYPLYLDQRYDLAFVMTERDALTNDQMGGGRIELTYQNGWGIGTHRLRSTRPDGGWGDYTIELEVRWAPLPDLRPVNIKIHELAGTTKKLVCMAVVNGSIADAGPFEVALRVDGIVPPGGRATAGRLASGDAGELCVEAALPDSGQHLLAVVVDEPRWVTEFNETNNVYEELHTVANASPSATPTPSPALPDLTVSAIRVRGQVPDGKDDCKKGRNDVAVLVKNAGAAKAGEFAVRLVVDGDSGAAKEEKVADGLEAGKELEVRFDDVRLK